MKIGDLISVIVPVYNVEKYIEHTINSILSQTYTNIELILINDGSTDASYDICFRYSKKDERVRLINKKNGGLSEARNWGIKEARGEYIVFIDGDDSVHCQMIQRLYDILTIYDADVSICSFLKVNEDTLEKYDVTVSYSKPVVLNRTEALGKLFAKDAYLHYTLAWNKMYKRVLFEDISYPIGKIHEDEFIAYKILGKTKRVVFIDEPLYYYMQRPDSIMKEPFSEKRFHKVEAYRERINYFIDEHKYEREAVLTYMWTYLEYILAYKNSSLYTCKGYRAYMKQLRDECIKYKQYISVYEYIITRMKIFSPTLFRIIRHLKINLLGTK